MMKCVCGYTYNGDDDNNVGDGQFYKLTQPVTYERDFYDVVNGFLYVCPKCETMKFARKW